MSHIPLQQKVNEYYKKNNIKKTENSLIESSTPQQDFAELKDKLPIEQRQFLEEAHKKAHFLQVISAKTIKFFVIICFFS